MPRHDTIKGIRTAPLGVYGSRFETTAVRVGDHLEMSFVGNAANPDPESDQALLEAGYATLTLLDPYAADTAVDHSGYTA